MEEARKGRQMPTLNDLSKMVYHSTYGMEFEVIECGE